MDIFIEKLVKKQKTVKDTLISVAIVLLAIVIVFFVIPFVPIVRNFAFIFLILFAYLAYYLISSRNIEYEYALTNSELDIDKIIAGRKRKKVLSIDCKNFDIVANVNSDKFTGDVKSINNRIEAVSSLNSSNIYFAAFDNNGRRTLLFFEPDERMLDAMWRYIPRKLFK